MHSIRNWIRSSLSGDKVLVAAFALISLLYGAQTWNFQTILAEDFVGPATFPRLIAVGSLLLCALYLFKARSTEPPSEDQPKGSTATDLTLIGYTLAYVLLLEPLGFLFATLPFVFVLMIYLGDSVLRSACWAVALTALFFSVFYFGLKAEVPMGQWISAEELFPFLFDIRRSLGG